MDAPVIGITGYADRSARPPNVSIFALARTYVRAVAMSGGAPVIIPPYLEGSSLRGAFDGIAGLLLSGGGDIHPSSFGETDSGLLWYIDRERDQAELSLARWALTEGRPVLGICRGIQTLNVAAGGSLIQDIPTQIPQALSHSSIAGRPLPDIAHQVKVDPHSRLAALIGAGDIGVNSAHHQAVEAIGEGLVAVARAADSVIEGLEAPAHPFCIGVQWHPEAMVESTPVMRRLFEGLIEAARV
jgi:putative glutamine amidotransferase